MTVQEPTMETHTSSTRDGVAPVVDDEVRPLPGALLIPLSRLERDPDQPRRDWRHQDTQERLAELVESVRTDGILQPLVVREHPDKPGHYIVVAGGMRFYAATKAGLSAVPACVRDTEGARLRALQLKENSARKGLSDTDEARMYREIMDLEGFTKYTEVARFVGRSAQHVRTCLKVLEDKELADAVDRHQISKTVAREIASMPPEVSIHLRMAVLAGARLDHKDIEAARSAQAAAGIVHPRAPHRARKGVSEDMMERRRKMWQNLVGEDPPAEEAVAASPPSEPAASPPVTRVAANARVMSAAPSADEGRPFSRQESVRDRLSRIEPQQDDVDLFGRYAQHLDPEAFEGVLAFAVARGMSVISLLNHWQRWRQERDLGRAGTPLS